MTAKTKAKTKAAGNGAPQSFFERTDEDVFTATVATLGPWGDALQHGGPISALLARALESGSDPSFRVARLTVSFNRPLVVASYRLRVESVRDGRKVKVMRAMLLASDQDRPTASAEALLIRRAAVVAEGPSMTTAVDTMPRPDACEPFTFPFFITPVGYHTAMETRIMHGTWGSSGRMGMWMRMRLPLVPGETPTPLQRAACAADSGNGISAGVDVKRYTFINPEVTVTLSRDPVGEWIGVDATTTFAADGIGLADALLLDERGPVGRGVQPLILDPR